MDNIILLTDSYKFSHYKQYPPKTTKVYSYFESRGGQFPKTVFFGLQYFIKKYLEGRVVTKEKIDYAEKRINAHMGAGTFNRAGWEYILGRHGGNLPVVIKAVKEGSVVDTQNALMTVENTDPNCFWLTNYLETLLVQTWYPTTVATQSYYMKKKLLDALAKTGDPTGIDFKLHDFGFRGVSSVETAGIGGAAHLVNFRGTDTFEGIEVAYKYYGEEMAGFSIPASEHSTITSWGREKEAEAMGNMLTQYPDGLVACVSDSFDIYGACEKIWGTELRDKVLARNGTLVIRPDSGNPLVVLLKIMEILANKFGYTTNEKGYKVLNPKVRVIQGDGIEYESLGNILIYLQGGGWSADNIAFGSGGGLLQKLNRDTCKFAFKCSEVTVDSKARDVFKDPATDPGKTSKKGRLALINGPDGFSTINDSFAMGLGMYDELETVFYDGKLMRDESLVDIRARAV